MSPDTLVQQTIESFKTAVSAIPNPPPEEIADTVLDVINDPSDKTAFSLVQTLCSFHNVPLPQLVMSFNALKSYAEKRGFPELVTHVEINIEKGHDGFFLALWWDEPIYIISYADKLIKPKLVKGHRLALVICHEFYHYLFQLLLYDKIDIPSLPAPLYGMFHNFAEDMTDMRGSIVMENTLRFLRAQGYEV